MLPFLRQVAAHYFGLPDIEKTCFIFPNRRSLVFFKKYLADEVAAAGNARPLLVPPLFTINDFFCQVYGGKASGRLPLLLELYRCYAALYPQAEPLDEFIFWGDTLLADFDDLDKYRADAGALLRNVAELKDIRDDFSYLSPAQEEAVKQFLEHFRDGKALQSDIKGRFASLWNILLPLYQAFRSALRDKGMAYEGMIYRDLADKLQEGQSVKDLLEKPFPGTEQFVFVGLNALNECERLVLRKMRDARLARFVWDYVSGEIRDKGNKSSFFLDRNVADFPQDFPVGPETCTRPEVTVVSVPSGIGQAKLAPQILAGITGDPVETAFILPDESLLLPLLSSIPPEWDPINITMGYPMASSAVYTLVKAISQLQLRMHKRQDEWYFYHKNVEEVFTCSLFREILSPEETAVVERVKAAAKYYIPEKDLRGGPVLAEIFRPVVQDPHTPSAAENHRLGAWLLSIVGLAGRRLSRDGDMVLELDFAQRCHTELTLLQDIDLEVLPATWLRMLDNLLQGISVPFRGEPLVGLQVMGPLETRALDFRNVIILGANEGVFPRRSLRVSFIPPQLRKGFGLPTYEYQDAVWAYYFYRLLQRAEKVWLVCDTRTEGVKSGEESRYIKQLQYYFHWDIQRTVAVTPLRPAPAEQDVIPKTEEHIRLIREKRLSASTLKNYLDCPAMFYYQFIEGLREDEEIEESLDAGMLGNVFHKVMKSLYEGHTFITREEIDSMRKNKDELKRRIRSAILEEMRTVEVTGRNLVLEEILLDYVRRTLRYDASLLSGARPEGFRILSLEQEYHATLFGGYHFKGIVDRIDSRKDGELRIVDYKTGKVVDGDLLITDENAAQVVEAIFSPKSEKRPKAALQLFLYGRILREDPQLGKTPAYVNALYSMSRLYATPLPDMPENPLFIGLMTEALQGLLAEMSDPSVAFARTQNRKTCQWCSFKAICGR